MKKRILLFCQVVSGIAIFFTALGLVGLVLSADSRVSGELNIGCAVLMWVSAYAMRRMLAERWT